jgi:hypothetical protein
MYLVIFLMKFKDFNFGSILNLILTLFSFSRFIILFNETYSLPI